VLQDIGLTKHFNLVVESLNIQLVEHETDPGSMANKEELDGLRKILLAQAKQQRGLLVKLRGNVERQEDFHIELGYLRQTLRDPMEYISASSIGMGCMRWGKNLQWIRRRGRRSMLLLLMDKRQSR
jgi:hypothetical protein